MECIGYWDGGYRIGSYAVCLDNGIMFVKRDYSRNAWADRIDFKREFGKRYFGDPEFLIGTNNEYVSGILFECDGKDEDGVREVIRKYKDRREGYRTSEYRKRKEWEKLREKFDGIVIGIDSKIDVYGSGFSVRVLFGSDVSFGGKKKFLAENRIEFVRWVIHELSESKSAMKKIGDMRFYRPVEIINLRAQEVEVKFEIKEVV